jgi:hypothetical protein
MHLWVEPAGGEQKSADFEWKMVTIIYPYPECNQCLFWQDNKLSYSKEYFRRHTMSTIFVLFGQKLLGIVKSY